MKRLLSLLTALILLSTVMLGAIPALAANEVTVRIHYHRPDGDYDGWQLWAWDYDDKSDVVGIDPDGIKTNSAPYGWEAGRDEVVFTIRVKTGSMRIGYIIRYGDWEAKDVDHDQYINLAGIRSGTVDFYVESGVPTQSSGDISTMPSVQELVEQGHMVLGPDVRQGTLITGASYKPENRYGEPEISLQLSSELSYTADLGTFRVSNVDGEIPVKSIRQAGSNYYLALSESLDLSRNYLITFEGNTYSITMPDYYSTELFEKEYTYHGDDLGQTYRKERTTLRVWAPTALSVDVKFYRTGDPKTDPDAYKTAAMRKDVNGTWVADLLGDMAGVYYTYEVTTDTQTTETCDPYARAVGINGDRAMIIDLDATDPAGWSSDKAPHAGKTYTDAVIYELHVRDISMDSDSGITNKGKYLGLIERGTKTPGGVSTGLDHMVDLGITHVHLLPVYDFNSLDERKTGTADHYNWGYDPKNYNVPEGSYSTDPYNGEVRVKEFKQMVKGLHDAGIGVIMDVVYNHVADMHSFCFDQIVDGYFTRPYSNGSGCGNDVATERSMVRKYIVDSVNYWVDEYHIDGFRFDLAGLIDIETINEIVDTVHKKHPDVIFYGEGWAAGSTVTTKANVTLATMTNASKTPRFAYFSDTIRNEVKGSTYGGVSRGFISGASSNTGTLFSCFKGSPAWCPSPTQTINYLSCHDGNTLYDHITMAAADATEDETQAMNRLGAAFYMTAQGIPFFQAGEEFLRSKPLDHGRFDDNSYASGDGVNALDWSTLERQDYQQVFAYYQGLIAFRKAHPALRLTSTSDAHSSIFQLSGLDANVVGYQITGGVNGETSDGIVAIFNANSHDTTVTLPEGDWSVYVDGEKAGTTVLDVVSGTVEVDELSALILVKDGKTVGDPSDDDPIPGPSEPSTSPDAPTDPDTQPTTPGNDDDPTTDGNKDPIQTPDKDETPDKDATSGKDEDPDKDRDEDEEDDDDAQNDGPGLMPIIIVAVIALVVLGAAAVAIILILRKK